MRRIVLLASVFLVSASIYLPAHLHIQHSVFAADRWTTTDCGDNNGYGSNGQARACELRTTEFEAGKRLQVNTENGGIRVIGEDRNNISVEARVYAWAGSPSEAKEILRQISIEAGGDSIRNNGPHFYFGNKGYAVDYKLRVPRSLAVALKSTNGGIRISHLNSDIGFETTNGGVDLEDLAGDVHGETTNGGLSVLLTGNRWNGKGLHAETTNGSVELYLPEGYSAHLETATVNGGFTFNVPLTFSGDVKKHLSLDLGQGGPTIHVETTNGGVTVSRSSNKKSAE